VARALRDLGATRISWTPDGSHVTATIHWSLFNRGELLTIKITKRGKVTVNSRLGDVLQHFWFTCGAPEAIKNYQNCENFFDALEDCLDERAQASRRSVVRT